MEDLSLNIEQSFDCRTLIINDSTAWDINSKISNLILEIKPPGKECFIPFILKKDWKRKVFNCSLLKICCVDCPSKFSELPDGVYTIKYSYDPNLKTMIEIDHLRTCQLEKEYIKAVCDFFSKKCDYKKSEYSDILNELIEIDFTIKAAKWKVEECLEALEGLELYKKAKDLLSKFTKDGGCGCN